MEKMKCCVSGIIILYNPDFKILYKSIQRLLLQVDTLYIIDNTPDVDNYKLFTEYSKVKYIALKENIGIAAAQNVGLNLCLKDRTDFVFFLDQDSIVDQNMVDRLILKLNWCISKNINIGAIGPRAYNRESNKSYKGSIKKGKDIGNNLTEVTEIINSASLIPISSFEKVGLMDASLFIDGVDHEWCWRGSYKQRFRYFIDEDSILSHKLGEGDRRFLFKKVAIPTPFRTYFQYRNYLYLIRRGYVPMYWKLSNGLKYLIKLFYYPLFISPRDQYLKNIIRGIKDGLKSYIEK